MRFSDFPFLRYLPFLVTGIFLARFIPPTYDFWTLILLGVVWLVYLLGVARQRPVPLALSSSLAYVLLLLFGSWLGVSGKSAEPMQSLGNEAEAYLAEIQRYDVKKTNSNENLLELFAIKDSLGWQKASGKVLLYHQSPTSLKPGEVVVLPRLPERIPPLLFPDEFDYQGYLAKKDIQYRQFVKSGLVKLDSVSTSGVRFEIDRLTHYLSNLLDQKIHKEESRQIANALLLGQRDTLDKEVKNAYSETGTMHILSVSGLHVGILYAILLLPLRSLKRDSNFRKGYLIGVVALIWLYSVMTGFSPSVVRAATMFSLITLGQMRKKKPSIWNVLAFSAMLMIVFYPEVISDVGFQLSYLAVAGIVGLQPLILRWWLPKSPILEYFWEMAAVSIAAQAVTFPLSVFYFHQFPTYFLIANLVVVPISFLVMAVGVPFLFLGWIPGLGEMMGWLINWLIYVQNELTFFIQLLPAGKIDRLTITLSGMVLVWVLLLIWGNWELGNRKKLVGLAFVFFGIWSADRLFKEWIRPTSQLWLFKKSEKEALIDLQLGDHHLSWNQSFPADQLTFSIDPNRLMHHRSPISGSLQGIRQDSAIWFPVLDFRFFPTQNEIEWIGKKPEKIQEFHRDNSGEKPTKGTILNQNAGFRAIF